MNRLEARLSKLENINTKATLPRLGNLEMAVRFAYILSRPDKFDSHAVSRLKAILSAGK